MALDYQPDGSKNMYDQFEYTKIEGYQQRIVGDEECRDVVSLQETAEACIQEAELFRVVKDEHLAGMYDCLAALALESINYTVQQIAGIER